jgi:3-hydroxyacyl-[acyl-carrier-protein] dehydratase
MIDGGPGPGAATAPKGRLLDADDIRRILPHRAPFLLLDRVLTVDSPRCATGLKNVTVSEPWFTGHFPERMIFPGVLLAECLAQLAGILLAAERGEGRDADHGSGTAPDMFLAGFRDLRFRKPVVPGDQVRLEVTLKARTSSAHDYHGVATVGQATVAHGNFIIARGHPQEV